MLCLEEPHTKPCPPNPLGLASALGGRVYTILCPSRPFMPNQYMPGEVSQLLPGGPSVEPRDEEMPELPPFPAVEDGQLQSSPRW